MMRSQESNQFGRDCAIVMGGSIGGLLAARVLSESFRQVLVIERDVLPDGPAPRKGTPHGQHAHGLLARGCETLDMLFPGYTDALVRRGALLGDVQGDITFMSARRRFKDGVCGRRALLASRALLEDEVRRRVKALPNVRILSRVEVIEPLYDHVHERVVGVRTQRKHDPAYAHLRSLAPRDASDEETFAADLVIDVTGRASRSPSWLRTWGYRAAEEERVTIGLGYATAYFERKESAEDRQAVLSSPSAELPRGGVLLAQEPDESGVDRWVLTFSGYAGDHPVPTPEGLRERAASLGSTQIARVVQDSKLVGNVMRYGFPHSQRRHYDALDRFPSQYLVMGDALASFNPVYGQGMTVASLEALALRDALREGLRNIHQRFFAAAAKIISTPWQIAVGADLAIPTVEGPRPLPVKLVNAYLALVFRAAEKDEHVSRAFFQVMHMLEEPASLFKAPILARVLWQSLQRWQRTPLVAAPVGAVVRARAEQEKLGKLEESGSW